MHPVSTPMSSYQHYANSLNGSNIPNNFNQRQSYLPLSANSYGNIIWVQGETGAKSYLLPPGSPPTLLLDSEANKFYIKSTDYAGMPTLKGFTFQDLILEGSPEAEIAKARQETDMLKSELASLKEEIKTLKASKNDTLIIQEEPKYATQPAQSAQSEQHNALSANVYGQVQQSQQYISGQPIQPAGNTPGVQPVQTVIPR